MKRNLSKYLCHWLVVDVWRSKKECFWSFFLLDFLFPLFPVCLRRCFLSLNLIWNKYIYILFLKEFSNFYKRNINSKAFSKSNKSHLNNFCLRNHSTNQGRCVPMCRLCPAHRRFIASCRHDNFYTFYVLMLRCLETSVIMKINK